MIKDENGAHIKSSENEDYYHRYDVAVIVFDSAPFKNITPATINPTYPPERTPVRLVGFGPYNWDVEWGRKSTGKNFTSKLSYCPSGSIEIRTPLNESKDDYILPTSISGDSGGPVFIEGTSRIVGIVSGPAWSIADDVTDDVACYASPILKENQDFLRSTVKELGANIPGIDKL